MPSGYPPATGTYRATDLKSSSPKMSQAIGAKPALAALNAAARALAPRISIGGAPRRLGAFARALRDEPIARFPFAIARFFLV